MTVTDDARRTDEQRRHELLLEEVSRRTGLDISNGEHRARAEALVTAWFDQLHHHRPQPAIQGGTTPPPKATFAELLRRTDALEAASRRPPPAAPAAPVAETYDAAMTRHARRHRLDLTDPQQAWRCSLSAVAENPALRDPAHQGPPPARPAPAAPSRSRFETALDIELHERGLPLDRPRANWSDAQRDRFLAALSWVQHQYPHLALEA